MSILNAPLELPEPAATSADLALSRRAVVGALVAAGASALLPRSSCAATRLILNDASRLDPTPVARHVVLTTQPRETLIASIRAELKDAAAAKRPVIASAARHSMGGQSLPRDGTAITLSGQGLEIDRKAGTYRVDAGARWADVIRTLDPLGLSPLVMQSNNDFGVASTFSVNAHGWPTPHGPFGSTVRALRMILADGSLVTCSRTENAELFGLAMGGYGLFGVIVDLEVEMTPNLLLLGTHELMPAEDFADRFVAAVRADPGVKMAYGRLSLSRKSFFSHALMWTYRPAASQGVLPAATHEGAMTGLTNELYRSQIGHEMMKSVRWQIETKVGPRLESRPVTRNTLMNEPVSNLANNDARRTDILHEYFVAPERFKDFLAVCRSVIPPAKAEFINVTLRYVDSDPISSLAYARVPRIAAVMSFSQEMTMDGEVDMLEMTERLIDGIVGIGGAFYLPYRLHARRDQIVTAYPAMADFVARKRSYDPGLVFRNAMWATYFA